MFVLGMLSGSLVGALVPPLAAAWPWFVALLAFAVAGCRARPTGPAHVGGAGAALVTVLLGLPLILLFPIGPLGGSDVAGLLVSAVLVGAVSGVAARNRRGRV
ncbi:hypothetical protein [Pseudonocardia endophytica]|uniref:hypothetical protein n=1 Tax=Pseudonocardia endophytica TaxID=401976 RepID=UPI00104B8B7A|nr:hypothetical protein [Pseudonocardia endophytica]